MDVSEIQKRKLEIIKKFGEWTAHSIELAPNIFTVEGKEVPSGRPAHYVKVTQDFFSQPLNELRVLDLGSLEGMYSFEFAKHGPEVVGIEGRLENIEKAKFANEVFGFNNCKLVRDDVRNLNPENYGTFDVVLCCGILYHLDAPDVFIFLEKIAEICERLLIVDTQIAVEEIKLITFDYKGEKFSGLNFKEQLESPWAALKNANSFWFDRKSLYRAIRRVGFFQIYEDLEPHIWTNSTDRLTLVCLK
jgi:2-polyprenyl-3-methyl-5-hydroxy-6-metoxy-1,4-benzoquinol methylase